MNKQTNSPVNRQTEVLIVGGGLVGATMAVALGSAGIACVVVDREDPATAVSAPFDGRASAIAYGSRRVFEGIGIWDQLRDNAGPIMDIQVSEAGSSHFLHYDHQELGDEPLGHMVENRNLRRALFAKMQQLETVILLAPNQISSLERNSKGALATLQDGSEIKAKLVIGCDGRFSKTRSGAGIQVTKWNYKQAGIVCTVRHQQNHQSVAYEHFLPVGPFAILPLRDQGEGGNQIGGHLSSIVWTENPALVPGLLNMSEDDFVTELGQRFGDFLGDLSVVGPRWSYPLALQYARSSTAQRLALAGDASHAMHPIAGQGLNMGIRDIAALAEVIVDAERLGEDIGSDDVLKRYARWRNFDNSLMLAVTDGINRLFSNNIGPLKFIRNLGFSAVGMVPPLKKTFMHHAMGIMGDLPRLMRGEPL